MFPTYPPQLFTPFEWSGRFDRFAVSAAQLQSALGIDGSVSPDLGNVSHLWNGNVLGAQVPVDIGTLAAPLGTNMDDSGGGASLTTDPNFGGGARDLLTYTAPGCLNSFQTSTIGINQIPAPSDGTKSCIWGMIYKVNAVAAGDVLRSLLWNRGGASNGFFFHYFSTSVDQQRFQIRWSGGAGPLLTSDPGALALGKPFVAIANLDVAAGLYKFLWAGETQGIVTAPFVDLGNFTATVVARVGYPGIAGWDGAEMSWAQIFSFEYSGALDGQLGLANLQKFLKFTDGYLAA